MRQFGLRSLGALLAVIMSAVTGGVRAAEPAPPIEAPDLRLVPADAAGVITLRVAAVADKLGLKEAHTLGFLSNWQSAFAGVRTTDLERFTVVFPTMNDEPVTIYRTAKTCDRDKIIKALAPDAKAVKRGGKVFHVNADGAAVHFADDCVFLYGPDKQVADVVAKRGAEGKSHLAVALRQATEHDILVWGRAAETDEARGKPTCAATNCCNRPAHVVVAGYRPARTSDNVFSSLGIACPFDCPFPSGLEAGDVFLDLGERVVLVAHLHFTDEDSARSGAKMAGVRRDIARAMLLMGAAQFAALESCPELVGTNPNTEVQGLAAMVPNLLPMIRSLEKSLEQATIEAEGTTVPITVSVPVSAKKVRSLAVAGFAALVLNGGNVEPLLPFRAWTSSGEQRAAPPAYPPPPAYCPRTPVDTSWSAPQPSCLPSVGQTCPPYNTMPPAPAGLTTPLAPRPPLDPASLNAPVMPAANWSPVPAPTPICSSFGTATTPTGSNTPAPVKLTVANVTKEPALLFYEGDNGKLVFDRKVPAGDVVDVETPTGKRWVAIFADNPSGETRVAADSSAPWLLRSARRDPPKTPVTSN